jgi:hypothetical protein
MTQRRTASGAWQQWQRSAFVRVRSTVRPPRRIPATMPVERTRANGREPSPRFDKLGVTGSSPVPPITRKPLLRRGFPPFPGQSHRRRRNPDRTLRADSSEQRWPEARCRHKAQKIFGGALGCRGDTHSAVRWPCLPTVKRTRTRLPSVRVPSHVADLPANRHLTSVSGRALNGGSRISSTRIAALSAGV